MMKKISLSQFLFLPVFLVLGGWDLPSLAQSPFHDLEEHWAKNCVEELTQKKIISGYLEDGTFRPDRPVTRAEFAGMVRRAFPHIKPVRKPMTFIDVPQSYWGFKAIQEAYEIGFISSYSGSIFNPEIPITRWQALVSLSNGLNYKSTQLSVENLGQIFVDANDIPEGAKGGIVNAIERRLVVNYPDLKRLNPNEPATRSEVASFLCQALLKPGQNSLISKEYIVNISEKLTPNPQIKVIESGPIKVEFSYVPQGENTGKDFQLKISRAGQLSLNEKVLIPNNLSGQLNSLESQGEGRFISLQISDLDRDGEPEIFIDLVSNQGVNYSFIYFYDSSQNRYQFIQHSWGKMGYNLVDLDRDNSLEFKSYDQRFLTLFPYQSPSKLPLRIWQYRQGKMEDVTKLYPIILYTHSSELWLEANQRLQEKQESQSLFSAYLATQYLLNKQQEGWELLEQVYQEKDRSPFFAKLQQFLIDTGYTTTAIYQAESPAIFPSPSPSISPQPFPPVSPSNFQVKLEKIKTIQDQDNPILSMTITPDNKVLLTGGDKEVKLWDIETGELITTLSGHQGKIWSMAISYDGNTLATGSGDGTVILWDLKQAKIARTLVHRGWVNRIEFSADGKIIISGTPDQGIKLWSVETGELLTTLEGKSPISMARLGRLLASGGEENKIKIWDILQQSLWATFQTSEDTGVAVRSLAMSRDGLTLVDAISAKFPLRVWDIRTQKVRLQLEGHTDIINSLAIHPNHLILASSGQDKQLKLWDLLSGQNLQTVEGFGTIIFSRDGQIMVNLTQDHRVLLWRLSLTKNL